jgi:hypothetical protein
MYKRFLAWIDFRKPSNYPAIAGWAETFAGCYAGWTMIYAAYGLAALKLPSWTILMPLGTIIILMLLVVSATRKRLMWAYYFSAGLLVQPCVKFIRAGASMDDLNVALGGSLLFSLAALVVLSMPAMYNWVKSRPNPKARKFEYYLVKGIIPIKIELDGLGHRYAAYAVNSNTALVERFDHYISEVENGQAVAPISESNYESLLQQFIHALKDANEQRKNKLH